VEILKQPQYQPQPVERQVAMIYAATAGSLDAYPPSDAKRFVTGLIEYLETRTPEILTTIRETGDLPEETEAALKAAIDDFTATFVPGAETAGSEAGLGTTTPPDEVKPDVGWDRMSSVDEDEPAEPPVEG
jgi:F-type H+-transporting ATPase subunit alpha